MTNYCATLSLKSDRANMFTGFYNGPDYTLRHEHLEADFDWLQWRGLKRAAVSDDSLFRPAFL